MSVQMIRSVSAIGDQFTFEGATVGAQELLSAPDLSIAAGADDVLVALAIAMVEQKRTDRASGDRQMQASAKAQETAHVRKIQKMHELADDTLMEGIVSGTLEGASAIASGAGAVTTFSSEISANKKESVRLARNAGLFEASSKLFGAGGKFGGSLCKSAQERDRADMAEADAAKDSAKASLDTAAATINRASEDIRATIAALRQLIVAKTQLANAAIMRG
jgi:hypothetical protein